VVDLDGDGVLLGVAEVDSQVTEVLDELACDSTTVRLDCSTAWGGFVCFAAVGVFVPRGPSTVTILVLMASLTAREKIVSTVCPSHRSPVNRRPHRQQFVRPPNRSLGPRPKPFFVSRQAKLAIGAAVGADGQNWSGRGWENGDRGGGRRAAQSKTYHPRGCRGAPENECTSSCRYCGCGGDCRGEGVLGRRGGGHDELLAKSCGREKF